MEWACAILSSVVCPDVQYNIFRHCLINGTIKKKLLNITCVFLFEEFLTLE